MEPMEDTGKTDKTTGIREIDLTAERKNRQEKKRRLRKRIGAGALAVVLFCGGALVGRLTFDSELRALARVKRQIQNDYYQEIDDSAFYGAVFDGVNGLLDDYSYYMTADEYADAESASKGERSGIGLTFRTVDEEGTPQLLITRVCYNSPAESAGLTAGWRVVGFGTTPAEIRESVVFEEFRAFLAERAAEETFYLRVVTPEENTFVVSLYKDEYVESYVAYRTDTEAYGFQSENSSAAVKRGTALRCLGEDTAYIRLVSFNGAAAEEFDKAMSLFREQGKRNLVLDLRENGGGAMNILEKIAKYFCKSATEKKPVVAVIDYGEKRQTTKASGNEYGNYFSEDSRIVVLADENSASASECLLGAMLDYGTIGYVDICLIGDAETAKTYGKGIMQTTYRYLTGDAMKLTTATVHWPLSDTCIHGRGILPSDGAKVSPKQASDEEEISLALQNTGIAGTR